MASDWLERATERLHGLTFNSFNNPQNLGTRVLGTYYAISAVAIYVFSGKFSSPNKRFRKLSLASLPNEAELSPPQPGAAAAPVVAGSREEGQKLKRQLSFLKDVVSADSNPFMNGTWEVTRRERMKYAVFGPILLPVRIVMILVLLVFGAAWAKLVTYKADLTRPLPKWRFWLQYPLSLVARGLLFSMGYWRIVVKGRPSSSKDAPILVANHISFVDGIILPASNLAMAVSRAENANVPFFGSVMRALQCVFVSRTDKDSRATVAKDIERRTKTERGLWGRKLMLFPEGTTTNGTSIISFKNGAFAPGVPVQPVAIKYPSRGTFDNCWVTGGPHPGELLVRTLLQPYNLMEIHYMEPYQPSAEEKTDPSLYARNVREVIAKDLGVPTTDHCFDDVLLLIEARKLGYRGTLKQCVIETKALRKVLEVDLPLGKQYLQTFARLDTEKKGELTYAEFVRFFLGAGKNDSPELHKLFDLLDTEERGAIRFKQFIVGVMILNEQGTAGFEGAMRLCFNTFDSSGEGRLSKADVHRVLGRWMGSSPEDLDKVFEEADVDKDGKIGPDEFLAFAKKHQDLWPRLRAAIF